MACADAMSCADPMASSDSMACAGRPHSLCRSCGLRRPREATATTDVALQLWPVQSQEAQAYFKRAAMWCDRASPCAKVQRCCPRGGGNTHRSVGSSRRVMPPSDSSTELVRRYVQRGVARPALEKLGSGPTPLRNPPFPSASQRFQRRPRASTGFRGLRSAGGDRPRDWKIPSKMCARHHRRFSTPEQSIALDKDACDAMEWLYVRKYACPSRAHTTVPRGRRMIGGTP